MAQKPPPKGAGRPTRYRVEFERLGHWMARSGLTNSEIAAELNVAESTLYNWMQRHPRFLEALKEGREEPDRQVEQSLFDRAIGYEYTETKIVKEAGKITRVERTTKFQNPDTTACIFWLKNRRPDRWRDHQAVQHELKGPLIIQRTDDDGKNR